MGEVIKWSPRTPGTSTAPPERETRKGNALCRSGFHKWEVVKGHPFDVKQGKLVSRYCCKRCGATRVEAR